MIYLKKPLLIFGTGGHSKSLASVAVSAGFEISGFIGHQTTQTNLLGFHIYPNLDSINDLNHFSFAIGVGDNFVREKIFNDLSIKNISLDFPKIISDKACISNFSTIDLGTIVMPGAIVGPETVIGKFCILNCNSSIDHDCTLGDFGSLAPGATTGGNVMIGKRSSISIGAKIKHRVTIGEDTVLGAQSYLNKDLPNNVIAFGTPAEIIRSRKACDTYL